MQKMAKMLVVATALTSSMAHITPAYAGYEPYIGQVIFYPYNFCPRGWASASGAILPIAQNTALFALLGTTYGGDGSTTFGLPDLRGRSNVGRGSGPGLSPLVQGETGGAETATMTIANMPTHTHAGTLSVSPSGADTLDPTNNFFAADATSYQAGPPPLTPPAFLNLAAVSTSVAGGSQPFATRSPYLTLTPCVALEGIFPARS